MHELLEDAADNILRTAATLRNDGSEAVQDKDRTMERFADGWMELLAGYRMDSEVNVHFDSSTAMTGLLDIPFTAVCEHHLLPFTGRAHVIIVPGSSNKVPGKSKYARVIEKHARRLTLEERIADDAARELYESTSKPAGVLVKVEATHLCVSARGVKAHEAVGVSTALKGTLLSDHTARMEALQHLAARRA